MTRSGRSWLIATLLGILSAILLAGCASWPDANEARTCRRLVPAINPNGMTFDVLAVRQQTAQRVEIDYQARDTKNITQHQLVCAFVREHVLPDDRLSRVWSDNIEIGPIRLAFLKRFWLNTPDAATSDPAPYLSLGWMPNLPHSVAVTLQHVLSALPLISIYAMLAPAYALIYGLLGRINLAFGEFAAIGGYGAVLGFALTASTLPLWASLLVCIAIGMATAGLHGYVAGRLVLAPLRRASGQHVLIATIGLALALQEYIRIFQGPALRWIEPTLNQPIGLARSTNFVVTVTPIAALVTVLAVIAACGLVAVMRSTRFGRHWRACADDQQAAVLFGINPLHILLISAALASALAGLAGVISTVFYGGLGTSGGLVLGLKALIAAIIGGIGSVSGALAGGIAIGALETAWSVLFPIEYRDLAVYGALAALLIWRPQGILPDRDPNAR